MLSLLISTNLLSFVKKITFKGTVAVANKKIIDDYTKRLQAAGLTVSMAPDDDFEGGSREEWMH